MFPRNVFLATVQLMFTKWLYQNLVAKLCSLFVRENLLEFHCVHAGGHAYGDVVST